MYSKEHVRGSDPIYGGYINIDRDVAEPETEESGSLRDGGGQDRVVEPVEVPNEQEGREVATKKLSCWKSGPKAVVNSKMFYVALGIVALLAIGTAATGGISLGAHHQMFPGFADDLNKFTYIGHKISEGMAYGGLGALAAVVLVIGAGVLLRKCLNKTDEAQNQERREEIEDTVNDNTGAEGTDGDEGASRGGRREQFDGLDRLEEEEDGEKEPEGGKPQGASSSRGGYVRLPDEDDASEIEGDAQSSDDEEGSKGSQERGGDTVIIRKAGGESSATSLQGHAPARNVSFQDDDVVVEEDEITVEEDETSDQGSPVQTSYVSFADHRHPAAVTGDFRKGPIGMTGGSNGSRWTRSSTSSSKSSRGQLNDKSQEWVEAQNAKVQANKNGGGLWSWLTGGNKKKSQRKGK